MARKLFFGFVIFAAAQFCLAGENPMPKKSILFMSNSAETMSQNAVINGARDAAKDLGVRYNADISIVNITPTSQNGLSGKKQAEILKENSASGDAIGAIVVPCLSEIAAAQAAVKDFAKEKPVALIETDLPASGRTFFVKSDEAKLVKDVFDEINPHLGKNNFKLIAVYSGSDEAFKTQPPEPKNAAEKAMLEALRGKPCVVYASSAYFSSFSEKFESEIEALDNYGILFLDANPLINSAKIKPDSDRNFIIVMSLRPHLSQYLRSKTISMCAGNDYYGYGYLCAVAIAEKYFEGKSPKAETRVLQPIKYKVYQTEDFDKNWDSVFK
ncbi:MAG: hypothetical protein IKO42_04135 [Opitutales bacterium]|nr:hypothetical protein [Opitutales bacterium]